MPINALITFHGVRASTKNSAHCYQTDSSSNFSGWARDWNVCEAAEAPEELASYPSSLEEGAGIYCLRMRLII